MKYNKNEYQQSQSYCPLLESAFDITGRKTSMKWEVEVAKEINIFKISTAAGHSVEKEGWFGAVYENSVVAPFGLANYLFAIFAKRIFIREIWPLRPEMILCGRIIEELDEGGNINFREWLDSKYFYAKAVNNELIDIVNERRVDLIKIREVRLAHQK